MRRKKKPHDNPYTMAVVVEYDTIVCIKTKTKLWWRSMAPLFSTLVCTKTKTIVPTLACFISPQRLRY